MSAKPGLRRVGIDCDGVLHSYTSPWVAPEVIPDPPVEGAIDWLNELAEVFEPVVCSTRAATPEGQRAIVDYLTRHGYEGPTLTVTDRKLPWLMILDDRAWRFEGPGTFPSVQTIRDAVPWNRRSK